VIDNFQQAAAMGQRRCPQELLAQGIARLEQGDVLTALRQHPRGFHARQTAVQNAAFFFAVASVASWSGAWVRAPFRGSPRNADAGRRRGNPD